MRITEIVLFIGSSIFIRISTSGTGSFKSEPSSARGVATHHSVIISSIRQKCVSPPPLSIPTIVVDETYTNIVIIAIVIISSFASSFVSAGMV